MGGCRGALLWLAIALLSMVTATANAQNFSAESSASVASFILTSTSSPVTNSSPPLTNHQSPLTNSQSSTKTDSSSPMAGDPHVPRNERIHQSSSVNLTKPSVRTSHDSSPTLSQSTSTTPSPQKTQVSITKDLFTTTTSTISVESETKPNQFTSDSESAVNVLSSSESVRNSSSQPVVSVFRPVLLQSPTSTTSTTPSENMRGLSSTSTLDAASPSSKPERRSDAPVESPNPQHNPPKQNKTSTTSITSTSSTKYSQTQTLSTVSTDKTSQTTQNTHQHKDGTTDQTISAETQTQNIILDSAIDERGNAHTVKTSSTEDSKSTLSSDETTVKDHVLTVTQTTTQGSFDDTLFPNATESSSSVLSTESTLPSTITEAGKASTTDSDAKPGSFKPNDGATSSPNTTPSTTKAASKSLPESSTMTSTTSEDRSPIKPAAPGGVTDQPVSKAPTARNLNNVAKTSHSILPVIVTEPTTTASTSASQRIRPDRPVVIVRVTRFVSVRDKDPDSDVPTAPKGSTLSVVVSSTTEVQHYLPGGVLRSGVGNSSPKEHKNTTSTPSSTVTEASSLSNKEEVKPGSSAGSIEPATPNTSDRKGSSTTPSNLQELDDIKESSTTTSNPLKVAINTSNSSLATVSSTSASNPSSSSFLITTMTSTTVDSKSAPITTTTNTTLSSPTTSTDVSIQRSSTRNKTLSSPTTSADVSIHRSSANDRENVAISSSSQMTTLSTTVTQESESPTKSAATTEALPPAVPENDKSSGVTGQAVTSNTPKSEVISITPSTRVVTSATRNIPVSSAAPSITPSYSSSFSVAPQSREVTYQTSESPSPETTAKTRVTIPLSSVATPALVMTVAPPDQDITSESPVPVTEPKPDKTAKISTSDFRVSETVSPSFSVYSVTPSSSHISSPTVSLELQPSSTATIQSSVGIVPSSTIDIDPTPALSVSPTPSVHVDSSTELTSAVESLTTASDSPKVQGHTTTERSTTTVITTDSTETPEVTTADEELMTQALKQDASSELPTTVIEEEETSETTTEPTTLTTQSMSKPTITIPLTYEPPLNTSDIYDEFWIITVLKIPLDVDTTDGNFIHGMEGKLARLFGESLASRRKRAATYNNITSVQMIMVNRSESEPERTALTYYVMHNGVPVPAEEAMRIINGISSQRLAIILGYEVLSPGEVYKKGPDRKLWIIGAVIGALVVLVSLIWCVLFVYFKCTRPAGKRSPRTARSNRTIDPEGSFRTNKKDFRVSQRDLRGFDIVRTEVGLESEILREKGRSSDSYRRMAGSSELEGMYSPGDTPPPDAPLVQHSQDAMASRPNSKVHSLSRPLPSLPGSIGRKGKGKKTREESSEGETTGSEKPLTPANKNQGRKKGRAWSKGHSEDSDEDSDDEDGGPVRTSHHGIRLPPLPNPPYPSESYRDSLRQQQELEDSLKNKAESERQRNKQRQRDKKKDKKSKKDLKREAEAKKAYKMVQKEMGQMLEEHGSHQPNVFVDEQKNKSKKKRQQNFRDSLELSELASVHQQVEQDLRGLSSLRGDSDEESRQKAFEEARQRMHALLDDAFALIAPNPSKNKIAPTINKPPQTLPALPPFDLHSHIVGPPLPQFTANQLARSKRRSARLTNPSTHSDEEQDPELNSQQQNDSTNDEKRHTPMQLTSTKDKNEKSIWSPYSAANSLAKIPQEELPDNYTRKYEEDEQGTIHGPLDKSKLKKKYHHGYKEEINPAYENSLKANKQEKFQKDYDDDSGYRTPGGRNRSSRADDYSSAVLDSKLFIPTGKLRAHSPPERDSNDIVSNSQVITPQKWKLPTDLPTHPNEVVSNNQSNKSAQKLKAQQNSPRSMDIYTLQEDTVDNKSVENDTEKKNRLKPSLENGEDEMDVVQKTVRHGVKEQPIVNSIRDELKRLAHRSSQDNEVN